MRFPSPDDPGISPVWENYVVAQTVEASRGQIPEHALAFGVEVDGARLRLRFQLSEVGEDDAEDMNDIVSELEALVGDDVVVECLHAVVRRREVWPSDGVRWVFFARVSE